MRKLPQQPTAHHPAIANAIICQITVYVTVFFDYQRFKALIWRTRILGSERISCLVA